ncbi:hypothetical protein EDC65_5007 [Stella humosa]|uniref:DUF2065 domain-containing protein n=1 Tax=Stella humosa TaxID=94 RepID=A0A3N1KPD9_9PROT|nr:DUF2065 domain-containing protein [Stella humosa]ROP81152.1 hypothetical protein EDC65_5007 [Stella humosa]BBK32497.1 hypothetical protein STHU_31310 [Stella humosa]
MGTFWVACGLVLVIEGLAYAAFPEGMRQMMRRALELPEGTLRLGGLLAAIVGVAVVWLVRG